MQKVSVHVGRCLPSYAFVAYPALTNLMPVCSPMGMLNNWVRIMMHLKASCGDKAAQAHAQVLLGCTGSSLSPTLLLDDYIANLTKGNFMSDFTNKV